MSKPANNPFFETDFSKLMDVSKMMGGFKIPGFDVEAMMSAYRRNMETISSVNQATFESFQTLARGQADIVRQGYEEATGLMNAVMSSMTPEEKVLCQAEASKAAMEKCMSNAREIAETVSKCHSRTMETVSNRMAEGLEELRGMMKNGKAAA